MWNNKIVLPLIVVAIRDVAQFLNAPKFSSVVFVESASMGTNSVLKSLDFKKGDRILTLSIGYDAVNKTIENIGERFGVEQLVVQFPFPFPEVEDDEHFDDKIVNRVEEAILANDNENHPIKLTIFDLITSGTAIRLPTERLVALSRKHNIPVFVDGAHGIGCVPIDLTALNPDYFVTNCHKHLCSPKGVAVLYVRDELKTKIHPLTTSHAWKYGFSSEFCWTGTHDYAGVLSTMVCLSFFRRFPGIMDRNRKLFWKRQKCCQQSSKQDF